MERRERRWRLDAVRALLLSAVVAVHAVWVVAVAGDWGKPAFTHRDWSVFWDAGQRLLSGGLAGLYAVGSHGFPFLYPPYVATLSAPLGLAGPEGAYLAIVALEVASLAAAVVALASFAPRRSEQDVVWLVFLASFTWGVTIYLGQPVALFLFAWLAGLAALSRDRPLRAGLAFGLLALKPTLLVAPLAYALVTRRRRLLAGIGIAVGACLLLSLPVGHFTEWLAALHRLRLGGQGHVLLWKQHTLLAFLASFAHGPPLYAAWAVVIVPLGVWTLVRARTRSGLRLASPLVLATLALGPYAYYYDAVLLAVPGAALFLERNRYTRAALWSAAAAAVATFAWGYLGFYVLREHAPAAGGVFVTVWLVAELTPPIPEATPSRATEA